MNFTNLVKRIVLLGLSIFVLCLPVIAENIFYASVSRVPNDFFGSWRVVAKRVSTDSSQTFKQKTVDIWNLFETNNVIKLSNPFTGAEAELKIEDSSEKSVVFSKTGKSGNKVLTDRVEITINGDEFIGFDSLQLDTISGVDVSVIKSETAVYVVKGERIAGQEILGD